jgi:hypothetical protein
MQAVGDFFHYFYKNKKINLLQNYKSKSRELA